MAIPSRKNAKERRLQNTEKSWIAKPILGPEYTEDAPLQEVYAGVIKDRKQISKAIRSITEGLPCFSHLKRCSGDRLLLVPLRSPASAQPEREMSEEEAKGLLTSKNFDLSLLKDDLLVLKVPSRAPRTKAQASRASKIWPVNFHPDPNVETIIDGSIFTDVQLNTMENYMSVAIEAATLESDGYRDCNGSAVIVDPEDGRILAIAASQINQHPMWHASMLAIDLVAKLHGGGAWKLSERLADDTKIIEHSKPNQDKASSLYVFNPNIDNDTELDKETQTVSCLATSDENLQLRAKSIKRKYQEEAPLCFPSSLSRIRVPEFESLLENSRQKGRSKSSTKKESSLVVDEAIDSTKKCGPYLCTGYWVFLLREPCPLCAMALLHSRVGRIFYGTSNEQTGILGTKAMLHTVPGLNHRYGVWSGILEQEAKAAYENIRLKHNS
ncbi:probable inactive tRNA-specific adenosine deaminase-like protein 3 [Prorops nasuta]|uniref:probable inactive tRNA-specific adenosine deaminase-like protein 3 n=1 Tax=Prorops nasuta TaxID=863751 RepID=UPI0034CF7CA0